MFRSARPIRLDRRARRCAVVIAFAGAFILAPTPSAAAPTRVEDQRLLSDATAPARSYLGSTVAISRNRTLGFALAGAPNGGTGIGAVEGFQYLPGVGFGPPLTNSVTAGTSCACPIDIEPLSWTGGEEWGVYPRRKSSSASSVLWYTPWGGGGYLLLSLDGVPVEAVAILEDTLVLGQPTYSSNSGRVLIYERGDDGYALAWQFTGALGERLGSAVGVGPSLVVAGAPDASPNGLVRTFVRTDHWIPWLTISSPAISQTGAKFGAALAVSLDGHRIAIGSPLVDRIIGLPGSSPVVDVGAVYLYEPVYIGWGLARLLRPTEAVAGDQFGSSVAMHRDVVVAGSPREDVPLATTGAAYVFEHVGAQWQETARLTDSAPETRAYLGASVAVGDPGILVGAPRYDGNGVYDQGAVLFYDVMESDRDDD